MNELRERERQVEQKIKDVSKIFEECVQEVYKGYDKATKYKIYVSYPKYDNSGYAKSICRLVVHSDSVDECELKNKMEQEREPIIRCVNKKLSNYPDEQIFHDGTPVKIHNEVFDLDKSQFLEVIESSLKNNWYGSFVIKSGKVMERTFYADKFLKFITGKDIREHSEDIKELLLSIFHDYDVKSIKEWFERHSPEIMEQIKNVIENI